MKNQHILYFLRFATIFLLFIISSCNSDESEPVKENPFLSFLNIPGITIDTIEKAQKVWEYGFQFIPLKNGIIRNLGIKVPNTGKFRVRFYLLDSDSLLIEKEIESVTKNSETYISLNELKVFKDSRYGLSLIADTFYKVHYKDSSLIRFPQTSGNINILSFHEEPCGVSGCGSFPPTTNSLVIAPCVTLVYIGDE
jgi:hypothetical protein